MSGKIATTDQEKELVWILCGLVSQHCVDTQKAGDLRYDDPVPLESGFIRINAEAIRLLNEYGLITDFQDSGPQYRGVWGKLVSPGMTAKILKTGVFAEEQPT